MKRIDDQRTKSKTQQQALPENPININIWTTGPRTIHSNSNIKRMIIIKDMVLQSCEKEKCKEKTVETTSERSIGTQKKMS